MPESDDFDARDRPHISINAFREPAAYTFPARAQSRKPLRTDYAAHAAALLDQLATALGPRPAPDADPRLRLAGLKPGALVAVTTLPPKENARTKAAKVPTRLEFPGQEILLVRSERNEKPSRWCRSGRPARQSRWLGISSAGCRLVCRSSGRRRTGRSPSTPRLGRSPSVRN